MHWMQEVAFVKQSKHFVESHWAVHAVRDVQAEQPKAHDVHLEVDASRNEPTGHPLVALELKHIDSKTWCFRAPVLRPVSTLERPSAQVRHVVILHEAQV